MEKEQRGFTLVELLVAIGLMVLLVGIVALIFEKASQVYKDSQARMLVYTNARAALETMSRDLAGTLNVQTGKQRFKMKNGPEKGGNFQGAQDVLAFASITSVAEILRPVRIIYELKPKVDPHTNQPVFTIRTHQQIFTLYREVYDLDGNVIEDVNKKAMKPSTLCEFITSFNLEYMAYDPKGNPTFYQLDDAPPGVDEAGNSYSDLLDPNADSPQSTKGIGDGDPPGKEPRVPIAIRVSMTVVENEQERSTRGFSQTIWIPIH